MLEQIQAELDAVERERGVRVLLAVESGSRCWGFASADSDWDVRFVYVRRKDDYLRLNPGRDTIEWRLDEELDVVGWDITKYLRLLRASNPTVFEWLNSTPAYREDPSFGAVREIAPACFNPVANAHHYMGMAIKHDVRYLSNERAAPKRYLYAVRALLACRWSIEERAPAPMPFAELVDAKLEPAMRPVIDQLVAEKLAGLEGDRHDTIPQIDEWIGRTSSELQDKMHELEAPRKVSWDVLNQVFLGLLDHD